MNDLSSTPERHYSWNDIIAKTSAFPYTLPTGDCNAGMTYREWLIGQALNGLLSNGTGSPVVTAEMAIRFADATIQKLANENNEVQQ